MLKKKKKLEEEGYEGMEEDELEEDESEKQPKVRKVKKRFVTFAQKERVGIMDTETNEIIAEGELGVYDALAKILENLERMEATMGSLAAE